MTSFKILISHTSVYGKSGWGRTFPLAKGLAGLGNNVTILTTNPKVSFFVKKIVVEKVKIIIYPEVIPSRISSMGFGFLSLILKYLHAVFNKYDVVHSDRGHRPLSGVPCRVNKKIYRSLYVAEWYDWFGKGGIYDQKSEIFKFFLGRYELKYEIKDKIAADGIVVLSELLRSRAKQYKKDEKIKIIHGGADVSLLHYIRNNDDIKRKYNIDKDTLTFGNISIRNTNIEEFTPLINAIAKVDTPHRIKILVFGDSEKIIAQIPIAYQKMFKFFGWIDYLTESEKLQCVDVFILFKENTLGTKAGWPNCLGDYLACGRPVLTNPIGEAVDFANSYPNVFFKTSRNEDDVFRIIDSMLKDKSLYTNNRDDARRIAEEKISWDSKARELFDFYVHLMRLKNES